MPSVKWTLQPSRGGDFRQWTLNLPSTGYYLSCVVRRKSTDIIQVDVQKMPHHFADDPWQTMAKFVRRSGIINKSVEDLSECDNIVLDWAEHSALTSSELLLIAMFQEMDRE